MFGQKVCGLLESTIKFWCVVHASSPSQTHPPTNLIRILQGSLEIKTYSDQAFYRVREYWNSDEKESPLGLVK